MEYLLNKSVIFAATLLVSLPVLSDPHGGGGGGGGAVVVDGPNATVTVDGIKKANEYTGGYSHGSKDLLWWNGHESIYTKAAGNKNELVWEINEYESSLFSLNIFFEVPTYARRMIWADGCDYNQSTNEADCEDLNKADNKYLDAYFDGTHHNSVKMNYETQTGSEYFELKNDNSSIEKIMWQDVDTNGLDDDFTWKTSREYLIENDICDTSLCQEYDMTSSIEIMWSGKTIEAATALLASISDMELHLSDEARGLPPVNKPDPDPGTIPEPSSIVLIALGLIGLRLSRKMRH